MPSRTQRTVALRAGNLTRATTWSSILASSTVSMHRPCSDMFHQLASKVRSLSGPEDGHAPARESAGAWELA